MLDSKYRISWELIVAGMLSLSLAALLMILLIIGSSGLNYFWPSAVYQFEIKNASGTEQFYGEVYAIEKIPSAQLKEAGVQLIEKQPIQQRLSVKIGNREQEVSDFINILQQDIVKQTKVEKLIVIERVNNGVFYGLPQAIMQNGQVVETKLTVEKLQDLLESKNTIQSQIDQYKLLIDELGYEQASLKKQLNKVTVSNPAYDELLIQSSLVEDNQQALEKELVALQNEIFTKQLIVQNRKGQNIAIAMVNVLDFWFPNQMNSFEKLHHWLGEIADFVSNNPDKTEEEKGIFPAIFGTILMVFIMSVVVMPLGVLAAVYLHEYAKKNTITRLIRIAVANLAGVPSIVYGVFGLGFFVYFLGGSIDKVFYADTLPNPTFGTPGLLWSSLTLGLLTLPVVIVSTEEGLKRIPNSIRDAAMALGATKSEALRTVILPMASPAMMTGFILAIARAAGEVAPLMLVGVVKLAQSLPFDNNFPYLHLDRKFMHLGYHIYDLSMSNANIEAIKPLVYATSLLLVLVVIGLNLTAIMIRHHLREKYRMLDEPA